MSEQNDNLTKIIIASGIGYNLLNKYSNSITYDDLSKKHTIDSFDNNPLLIVSNHMTLVDSSILHSYFLSVFKYYGLIKNNFRPFVWNLPAKENLELLKNSYENNLSRSFFYKFGRIVPIERNDPDSAKKTLDHVVDMMINKNHVFNIFPEAGRTRRDEFDKQDITPGASKIIYDIYKITNKFPNVLCVYLRSEKQKGMSDKPFPGTINIVARKLDMKNFTFNKSDLRNKKQISDLIGNQLDRNQIVWKSQLK